MFSLAKIPFFMHVVMWIWIAVAFCLILIVLLQKGKGGGVGSMFGGAGASSLLGTKTGDFLTWVTISMVALFLVLAVLMDKYLKPQISSDLTTRPAPTQPIGTTPGAATAVPQTGTAQPVDIVPETIEEPTGTVPETIEEPEASPPEESAEGTDQPVE